MSDDRKPTLKSWTAQNLCQVLLWQLVVIIKDLEGIFLGVHMALPFSANLELSLRAWRARDAHHQQLEACIMEQEDRLAVLLNHFLCLVDTAVQTSE